MDDILKRVLEAEREAARIVAAAQAEAQRIAEAGRQQMAGQAQRLRAGLAEETRRLVEQRMAEAEQQKAEALRAAEVPIEARARRFAAALLAQAGRLESEVAYPLDPGAA